MQKAQHIAGEKQTRGSMGTSLFRLSGAITFDSMSRSDLQKQGHEFSVVTKRNFKRVVNPSSNQMSLQGPLKY